MQYPYQQYPGLGVAQFFDPCPHLIRLILIRCGQLLYPEEKNLSVLVDKVTEAIGLMPFTLAANQSFRDASMQVHPVTEAIKPRLCPKCGKESVRLFSICHTCKDLSEGGKYKTIWACKYQAIDAKGAQIMTPQGLPVLKEGCGYMEKSEKSTTEWLDELGIKYENQTKRSLGIQTLMDKGVE